MDSENSDYYITLLSLQINVDDGHFKERFQKQMRRPTGPGGKFGFHLFLSHHISLIFKHLKRCPTAIASLTLMYLELQVQGYMLKLIYVSLYVYVIT